MPASDAAVGNWENPEKNILVKPVQSETVLLVIALLFSALEWVILTISVIGIIYAVLIGVFFYFIHIAFIYHIRGSSIKLGAEQFPELYERVVTISRRLGLKKVPAAYLHQSGGVLNAFATKFGRSRFVVLNSALVEACRDRPEALDFIIGHEVGHLHRNHLLWRMLIAPARLVPFLGSAYSRACELTCDRYGFACVDNKEKCTYGLVVLAAGAQFADRVDQRQFIKQKQDTMGFFMQIAQWLSSYPSLATRLSLLKTGR